MGWLAIVVFLVATIWIWISFGVLPGVIFGIVGFVALNYVGPKIDERFRPRSKTFLEFHDAWDLVIGPPTDVDALSAKRHHLSKWRSESKKTGESALEWIERTTGRQPDPIALLHSLTPSLADMEKVIHEVGADWPDRDHFDRPELRAATLFFDEDKDEWRGGTLIASLLVGVSGPSLNVHIFDGEINVYWTRERTWLVDRLDLDYRHPAYELRGMTQEARNHPAHHQRILFTMTEPGITHLVTYLDNHGPDTAAWIDIEPPGWNRLAPPDPFT